MSDVLLKKKYLIASVAILVIAAALRIYHLGDTSLWLDEAKYANFSYTGFADFIYNTRHYNSSPIFLPLIYWLLGDLVRDPFWIRVPPMIFGLLSVYILLKLPKVGFSRSVAMTSALWLAILPVHIQYSQEVREYSLSVMVSCLLIFSFFKALSDENRQRFPIELCVIMFVAPLAAYGNIFLAGILLALFIFIDYLKGKFSWSRAIPLTIALCISLLITYFVTVRYQIWVHQAKYLVKYYPPEDKEILHTIKWFIRQNYYYLSYSLGGLIPAVASSLVVVAFIIAIMKRRIFDLPEVYIVTTFVVLAIASNVLALVHMYPFGGMRNQLFASPLMILATVSAGIWLIRKYKYMKIGIILFVLFIILPSSLIHLSGAYGEVEDIISPVSHIDPTVDDKNVFIYRGAIPAIRFHYPHRKFYVCRGDIEAMFNEVVKSGNGKIYLLFSHVENKEDQQLILRLMNSGYEVLDDRKYTRSRLVLMEKGR